MLLLFSDENDGNLTEETSDGGTEVFKSSAVVKRSRVDPNKSTRRRRDPVPVRWKVHSK